MASKDAIKVGVDIFRGIVVHAKGNPATVVAVGAAAAVAAVAAGVGYGAYMGVRWVAGKRDAELVPPPAGAP